MRTLVVVVCTLAGMLVGGVLDLVSAATANQLGTAANPPFLIVAVGGCGLLVGLLLAWLIGPRRPRPPIDLDRYPNRIIGGTRRRGTPAG